MKQKLSQISKINANSITKDDKKKFLSYLDTANLVDNKIINFQRNYWEKLPKSATRKVTEKTILYSKVRPVKMHNGIFTDLDFDNIVVSNAFFTIDVDESIADPHFIYYYLTDRKQISKMQILAESSTTYPTLSLENVENFEIELPNINAQVHIGNLLSNIDKKINLNNKINDNLVKQAKLAYDYLFKNKQRNRSYNFDDQENVPLKDFCENIITGKTPPTTNESFFNGDIPFITIEDLSKSIFITKTHRTLSAEGANFQSNKFIPSGSLCVSCIATIGKIGFTTSLSQTNQQINSVIFPDNKYNNYIYFALEELFRNASFKTGNVFANLNKTEFSEILILKPSDELLLEFNKTTSILFKKIRSNSFENDTLYSIREKLLPLLMNGQVTIED
ncbi:restriction endonuclease subunit S [Mycoplasma bovis]|uniref:Type I restriction enzyme,S subunit n=3 Tax=Mycoplasmopsis bovis TaxID=28903 RepID=A0A059Y3C1_MYCBV|nr:restriction endonuclease subunit S [Mycoplasmopsis bovis]AEI89945.1 Type I restriction-modification system specificity subunit [Mycoplasmopsis bovis Hubei-1]AFM51616.1 type I restriction enzyme S subunit [Mycoplasmopsis bovis HB0801]AIA33820.1 type I restriction enzyme,S subunit [Mycoplasmopsis bovis CQ-W70]AKO50450.1 restriction endonuclease subunit S [Mycoplasmopsis bovis]AMW24914.1 Type I restriction-modification system specificity subunit [Mycoplasmopsis bovis]